MPTGIQKLAAKQDFSKMAEEVAGSKIVFPKKKDDVQPERGQQTATAGEGRAEIEETVQPKENVKPVKKQDEGVQDNGWTFSCKLPEEYKKRMMMLKYVTGVGHRELLIEMIEYMEYKYLNKK